MTGKVTDALDDEWVLSQDRFAEYAAKDTEQDWTEVTDEAIRSSQNYFAFSDAEGWCFYLPAHMSYSLRRFPQSDCDAVYWACVGGEHLDQLDAEQLGCVRAFLALIHEQG